MKLSQRIERMQPSATVELSAKIAELTRQGVEIIALNVGEPDFSTPDFVNQAAIEAIREGFTKYTPVAGIYELRKAISEKFEKDNQLKYSPDDIIVSTGAKQAIISAVLTLCEKGDEVIIPTPCWVSFVEMVKLADATPVPVNFGENNCFGINIEKVAQAITPRTRVMIVNSPNNPTGVVYKKQPLERLAELALKHNFYIISDEIYEKLVYDDSVHTSIASLSPEIFERTVTVNGFSKSYAMTGWRIGYAAGPRKIIAGMRALQGHMTTTTNSITQKAALAALRGPQETVEAMRKEYNKRRLYLLERLQKIEMIKCTNVAGAFYLLPNISRLFGKKFGNRILENSIDVANFFLDEARVALVPGDAFNAPNHIRISYSDSMENLKEAMDRLERILM